MNFKTEFLEKRWQKDYDHLKKEHESFIDYFDKNRKCRCDINICRHLEKIEEKMFEQKYYDLVNRQIIMGLNTMAENIPELFTKKSKLQTISE